MPKEWKTPGGTAAAVCLDMLEQPHLLIAGSTGSGKSVLLNTLIYTALYKAPHRCRFILIDPKRVELIDYPSLSLSLSLGSNLKPLPIAAILIDRSSASFKNASERKYFSSTFSSRKSSIEHWRV